MVSKLVIINATHQMYINCRYFVYSLIKIKMKKKENSVKPNKSGSTSSEKGETADTIHLTR